MMQCNHDPELCIRFDHPNAVAVNSAECCISGWLYDRAESVNELTLEVEGRRLPVYRGLRREDVAENLRTAGALNSGFIVRFATPLIDTHVRLLSSKGKDESTLADIRCEAVYESQASDIRVRQYYNWLSSQDSVPFPRQLAEQNQYQNWPKITIIVTATAPHPYLFDCCVRSIRQQEYGVFQCIVVGPNAENLLAESNNRQSLQADARFLASQNSQLTSILAVAEGEFVIFMNDEDELHARALAEIALCLTRTPELQVVFTDEDCIDIFGFRGQPEFKADFDLDQYLTKPHLGRLTAFRRDRAAARSFYTDCLKTETARLVLEVVERYEARAIGHIPKLLYHKRLQHPFIYPVKRRQSCRCSFQQVTTDYLRRQNIRAIVEETSVPDVQHISYSPEVRPTVAVILSMADDSGQRYVLDSNARSFRLSFYTLIGAGLIADNDANGQRFLSSVTAIQEDVILFVNRPLETVNHFFVQELVTQAMRSESGLTSGVSINLGAQIVHSGFVVGPDGSLVDPGVGFPFCAPPYLGQLGCTRQVEAVSDEFFAIRTQLLAELGGLGEVSSWFMPRFVERLCVKVRRRGLKILITPYAVATFEEATPSRPPPNVPTDQSTAFTSSVKLNPNLAFLLNGQTEIDR